MANYFIQDQRLGILIPHFNHNWDLYNQTTKQEIIMNWEKIRGQIPDRITELEQSINTKQAELNEEENFSRSCQLNFEIAELASIINDLWLWFRTKTSV